MYVTFVGSMMHALVTGSNIWEVEQAEQVMDVKLKYSGSVQLMQLNPLKYGWESGQELAVVVKGGGDPA